MAEPSFSLSALDRYNKCSESYKLWYLSDLPRPEVGTPEMMTGTVVHEILEAYYADRTISVVDRLEKYWKDFLAPYGAPLYSVLHEYRKSFNSLARRAGKEYRGPDAIRAADGKVSKAPHLTAQWQRAVKDMALDTRKAALDKRFNNPWHGVSVCDVFVDTWACLETYVGSKELHEVMHIEVQFDGLVFPTTEAPMNGFIDLVVRTPTGDILLVDHKTTARQPSSSFEIGFNEQLLVYGWALYKKFGIVPHRIALNYVRFDRLVDAPFDMARAEAAIARQEAAVRGVRSNVFIKQNPTSFHQQCHNKFLKRTCSYLSHCHPDYAAYIERSNGDE